MISKNAQNILFFDKKIVTRRSNDPLGTLGHLENQPYLTFSKIPRNFTL